jgi:hypothetical protein
VFHRHDGLVDENARLVPEDVDAEDLARRGSEYLHEAFVFG